MTEENCAMASPENDKALLIVLQHCRDLITLSTDSDWARMGVAQILEKLDFAIHRLIASEPVNTDDLRFLFAPTGSLQETSMSNGWGEEFLALAERFDYFIAKVAQIDSRQTLFTDLPLGGGGE